MRHLSLLALALLSTLTTQAQRVSEAVALTKASQFFQSQHTGAHHGAPSRISPELAYTAETKGEADFYVFNRSASSEGFVIINADESGTPILGYSMSSTFVADNLPDNMRWWISQYQKAKAYVAPTPGRVSIHDLIKTKWNQGTPFNSRIPTLGPSYKKFVTGCTATAMAQVMKFWEYPTKGVGSNSYSILYNGTFNITFSVSYSNTTYDWANMLDDYSHGYTTEEEKAVATLMYHAGVAENSIYGSSSNGTQAPTIATGPALLKHFDYDKGMRFDMRDDYTDAAWEEMIYSELSKGRPIIYSGKNPSNPESGHCFVCHGYNAQNGLYAINWGWGGYADGYFALTGTDALLPDYSGAGGGSDDEAYSANQSVYTHIQPNKGNEYEYRFCAKDIEVRPSQTGTAAPSYTINRSGSVGSGEMEDGMLYLNVASLRCVSMPATEYELAVAFRSVETGKLFFTERISHTATFEMGAAYINRTYGFRTSDIPCNGTYEVLPAFKHEGGSWTPADYTGDPSKLPLVTVKGGTDAERAELPISLPHDQLQVSKTMVVACHGNYNGNCTFTSSDPSVATVSSTGVITGLSVGTTTITVEAEGDSHFLPTTERFTLHVTPHVTYPVELALSAERLHVGETLRVKAVSPLYDGVITCTPADKSIISVDASGNVRGLEEGTTTLTIVASAKDDFEESTQTLTVTVGPQLPEQTSGLCFYDTPYIGASNIVTDDNMNLVRFATNKLASGANFYAKINVNGGYTYVTTTLPSGYRGESTYNLAGLKSYMTPGKFYTIEFYLDEEFTQPMNVPSIRFYYAKSNQPTVGELVQVINTAKEQGGIKKALIRALADKVLKF